MKQLESDWKIYSRLVPLWRERYLARTNREIVNILTESAKTPTEQFWEARSLIDEKVTLLSVCFGRHSRSKMEMSLCQMRRHGLIEDEDLKELSQALREEICR